MAEQKKTTAKNGRPQTLISPKIRCVYLEDSSIEHARVIGEGNISNGIRIALAEFAKHS